MNPYSLIVGFEVSDILKTPIETTDFTDHDSCLRALILSLRQKMPSSVTLYEELYPAIDTPEDMPRDAISIVFAAHPDEDYICLSLYSEEVLLNHGYYFSISPGSRKIALRSYTAGNIEKMAEEGAKIILEYGSHIDAGIRWAAYFLSLYSQGSLQDYFENERYQEIH